jgi:hypothetical protein
VEKAYQLLALPPRAAVRYRSSVETIERKRLRAP